MISNINLNLQCFTQQQILPKVSPMDFKSELSLYLAQLKQSLPSSQFSDSVASKTEKFCKNFSFSRKDEEENEKAKSILSTYPMHVEAEFKLELSTDFENPIFKGKYFQFKVLLKQLGQVVYPLSESPEIEVLIFSQEDILINKNMRGQEILRGNPVQKMHYNITENIHLACFKIQITEVSSHFLGKTLNMKIRPRRSDFLKATGWKLKPICISNIVVKAKKTLS